MKNFSILLLVMLSSCMGQDELLFVRDTRYFEPQFRQDTLRYNKELYSLHRRYFVFGYSNNKERFDSVATDLVCHSLNDSLLLSYIIFDFQDMGRWSRYEKGDILSADFTSNLAYFTWDISNPDSLNKNWNYLNRGINKHLPCVLKSGYNPYLNFQGKD